VTAGDAWLRRAARPRGKIDPEPSKREPSTGELASGAIRNAARKSLRRVAPPGDSAAGQ